MASTNLLEGGDRHLWSFEGEHIVKNTQGANSIVTLRKRRFYNLLGPEQDPTTATFMVKIGGGRHGTHCATRPAWKTMDQFPNHWTCVTLKYKNSWNMTLPWKLRCPMSSSIIPSALRLLIMYTWKKNNQASTNSGRYIGVVSHKSRPTQKPEWQ